MKARLPQRRSFKALVVALLVVVGLSACVKVDATITINPDDTFSGEIIDAYSKEYAEKSKLTPEKIAESIAEASKNPPAGMKVEAYSDDKFIGHKLIIDKAPINEAEEVAAGAAQFSIVRENDSYKLSGKLPLKIAEPRKDFLDLMGGADELGKTSQVKVAITFPGKVASANGKISGNTVTWIGELGKDLELQAVGSAKAEGASSLLLWGLIGVAVVVVASGATFFLLRKNKAAQPVACDDRAPFAASEPLAESAPAAGQPGASAPTDSSGSGQ